MIAAVGGFALSQQSWPLALFAAVLCLVFWALDAYATERENTVVRYLAKLEELSRLDYEFHRPNAQAGTGGRLDRRLRLLRVGVVRDWNFKVRDVWFVRPMALFRFLYPALIFALLILAGFLALADDSDRSEPADRYELIRAALPG